MNVLCSYSMKTAPPLPLKLHAPNGCILKLGLQMALRMVIETLL